MSEERKPWERIAGVGGKRGESAKAFSAFCVYRDLSPETRSIVAAVEKVYPGQARKKDGRRSAKVRLFERWSGKYHWVPRSLAYDEERDRINRIEQKRAIEEMNRRHTTMAQMLQRVALTALQDLERYVNAQAQKQAGDPDARPLAVLSPHTLSRILIESAKMERIARAMPAEVAAVQLQRMGAIGRDVSAEEFNRLAVEALQALGEQGFVSFGEGQGE